MARWLHNEQIAPKAVYRNLITAALLQWNELRVEIALDTSGLWNRFVIVRVSVIYRGRAIPLAWKVLERKSVSVSFSDYADLLWTVRQMIPLSCKMLLLADREFVDSELMCFARQFQWDYILRAQSSLWVHHKGHASVKLGQLVPPQGQIYLIPAAKVTANHFGPVALAMAYVRTQGGYPRWFLLTNTAPLWLPSRTTPCVSL
jgi:hypothetical protein